MGAGDWIMATAQARLLYHGNGKKCVFRNVAARETYWHEVFEGNPAIEKDPKDNQDLNVLENYQGHRPYFHGVKHRKVIWNKNFRAIPGDIFLSAAENSLFAKEKPFVLVEPNVHAEYTYAVNKDWGFGKWQTLIDRNKDVPWLQPIYPGSRKLQGVRHIDSPTFRTGCCLVQRSLFVVGTDGGLIHAAAALDKQAVVIWGGFTSPKYLGYSTHINIHDGGEPCGTMQFCGHCKRAMKAISVERVEDEVSLLLSLASNVGIKYCVPSPEAAAAAQLQLASGTGKASQS